MRRSIVSSAALAALLPAAAACAEVVDFQIVAQDVTVNRALGKADFSVTFSRSPVFVTVDTGQADAFQYEIDGDTTSLDANLGWSDVDAIIRGGEIWEGQGIPVRFRTGDGGPNAGGWGPVRALLPFELNDNTVHFSAPLGVLDAEDGSFRYRAISIERGAMTGQVVAAVIPLPSAFVPGLTLLSGALALRSIRRRTRSKDGG